MTAKKPTCGTGLKISILYYMTASQVPLFYFLNRQISQLQYEWVFSCHAHQAGSKNNNESINNFAITAAIKSASFLYRRTEHNQEWESIHL